MWASDFDIFCKFGLQRMNLTVYQKKGKSTGQDYYTPEELSPELKTNRAGVCIRGGRVKEDLTQKQLAEQIGIAQHHISEMENGKRTVGKEMAKKLAEVLNVDYRVFL